MLGIFFFGKQRIICNVYVRNKTLKLKVLPQAEGKRSKIPLAYAWVSTVSY
jgi:hypothetical protein